MLFCNEITVPSVYSQKAVHGQQKLLPLESVLQAIEETFDIRFSYSDSDIKGHEISFDWQHLTLDEILSKLTATIPFVCKRIDMRYVTLQKKNEMVFSICGYVLDSVTNDPIPFASVTAEDQFFGELTDSKGYFELDNLVRNTRLQIAYFGYKNTTVSAIEFKKSATCKSIYLYEATELLNEVLITDYLAQGMQKKKDGSIQVSPRKLGLLPGLTEPDIFKSLQLLPGVQSSNESASVLHIRGGTPDHNLVLVDGITLYETGHFFGLISAINPYVINTVNFFKNAAYARYGQRIGGVLAINTGDDISEVSYGFGSNLLHADAFVKTPLFEGKTGIVFSFRRSLTDVFNSKPYASFSETTLQDAKVIASINQQSNTVFQSETQNVNNFFYRDFNWKVIQNITEHERLTLSGLYTRNKLDYQENSFENSFESLLSISNTGLGLKWDKNWGTSWSFVSSLSMSKFNSSYVGTLLAIDNGTNSSSLGDFKAVNSVTDFEFKNRFDKTFSQNTVWSFGYQLSRYKVHYDYYNSNRGSQGNNVLGLGAASSSTHSIFATYNMQTDTDWGIMLGVRVPYYTALSQFFTEPRVTLTKYISESLQLCFSAEAKSQLIRQIDEYRFDGLDLTDHIWVLANDRNVPFLKNIQYSIGGVYHKKGWSLDVDFYSKQFSGVALLSSDIATLSSPYLYGTSNTYGIDILLKKRFNKYKTWLSYTLSNTSYSFEKLNNGARLQGMQDIPHTLVWSHNYSLGQVDFSLGLNWHSGIPYTAALDVVNGPLDTPQILYGNERNTERLPAYKKVDFSVVYNFSFSKNSNYKGKLGLSLGNVFDTENILDRTNEIVYSPSTLSGKDYVLEVKERKALGRTPNLVFRFYF